MAKGRFGLALLVVFLAARAPAADPPPLLTAQGAVEKVGDDTLTIKTRGPDGKFGKNLVLKITGTSKGRVTTLAPRMQKGNVVLTQKDMEVKELRPKQTIAVLYTMVKGSPVLLAAVAQAVAEK